MKTIIYYLLPGTGSRVTKKEGTAKDLLLDMPYLLGMYPPLRKEGIGVIPPLKIINEIFSIGINDAGMSGGCKWEPFQIDENDFEELVAQLLSDDPKYFRWIEPAEWVKTYDDWTAWKFELIHGGPSQEYRKLWSELKATSKAHIDAGKRGDEETEKKLYEKYKGVERKFTDFMNQYLKHNK